jgi:hypothetical protein
VISTRFIRDFLWHLEEVHSSSDALVKSCL